MSNAIEKDHLHDVCKVGQGAACCRYITAGPMGILCEKHGKLASVLDRRVAEGNMVAKGDNCEGLR